jgi:hypothetical protein
MHGRIDPVASAMLRDCWIETDLRTGEPRRRVSAWVEPRPYGAAGAKCERRRVDAAGVRRLDPNDPASANVPVPNFSAKLGRDIKGMRIGLLRSLYGDNCDSKVRAPFEAAVKEFERMGAQIVEIPSITLAQSQAIEWPALFAETAAIHVDNVRHRGNDYNPHAKLFVAYGLLVSGACYLMSSRRISRSTRRFQLHRITGNPSAWDPTCQRIWSKGLTFMSPKKTALLTRISVLPYCRST